MRRNAAWRPSSKPLFVLTMATTAHPAPVVALTPPRDSTNVYVPAATPGGRPPHAWLGKGYSLYDLFGFEWTLPRLGRQPPDSQGFERAASTAGLALKVVDIPSKEILDIYSVPLVLMWPDHIVAWHCVSDIDAAFTLAVVTGNPADVYRRGIRALTHI